MEPCARLHFVCTMIAFSDLPQDVQRELHQLVECRRYEEAANLARQHGASVLDPEFDI